VIEDVQDNILPDIRGNPQIDRNPSRVYNPNRGEKKFSKNNKEGNLCRFYPR
jgi:hypothetical protein